MLCCMFNSFCLFILSMISQVCSSERGVVGQVLVEGYGLKWYEAIISNYEIAFWDRWELFRDLGIFSGLACRDWLLSRRLRIWSAA